MVFTFMKISKGKSLFLEFQKTLAFFNKTYTRYTFKIIYIIAVFLLFIELHKFCSNWIIVKYMYQSIHTLCILKYLDTNETSYVCMPWVTKFTHYLWSQMWSHQMQFKFLKNTLSYYLSNTGSNDGLMFLLPQQQYKTIK